MATTVEANIMAALFARVGTLTLTPALPISWPNVTFTPAADQHFLRVQFFPNRTDRFLIDSDGAHRRYGLLQLSVMWAKNAGESAPREAAGLVAAHFPCDLRLVAGAVSVRVTEAPNITDLMVTDERVMIPVMIAWECFA